MSRSSRNRLGVVLFMLLIPLVANGYTIVFRGGRKVEIPDKFVVKGSTLTYEAGEAIQITLQLSAIDIGATEKANNEAGGSLMKRLAARNPESLLQNLARSSRTITNEDLEGFRSKRLASEAAYERRRKELGLPSAEESRQERLTVGERAQTQLLSLRSEEQGSESYWRNRAAELREEISATNARVNFVRARLNELPLNYSFGGFAIAPTFISVDQLTRGGLFQSTIIPGSNLFRSQRTGISLGFGNRRFGGQAVFSSFPRRGFNRRPFANRFPFGSVIALPFDSYDISFERATLLNELDQLLSHRAGLQTRWRILEEEARTSGAYPGWLR
jgi:hypothetical protein